MIHLNVDLSSSPLYSSKIHSHMDFPSPSLLEHNSSEIHSNVDLSSSPSSNMLKCKSSCEAHPNTSLPFAPSTFGTLPPSPANVLNPHGIAKLLKRYPNR